ncbi:RES family NAD+ phosphorylase [uncultured Pelagimonas sp.]|uniref:RES family NAD+ phosphorylase n=1 Tax=uncultured Pelagimonas sp. TaxID=1618102 RepID=UPI002617774E|nr:RES family NAD+ phosphorylase [uncultured Pelagimonas sp.]
MIDPRHTLPLSGRFWRSAFSGQEDTLLAPAQSPNGRWHQDGQKALYLSETPEGCRVALRVYVKDGDPARKIYPIQITHARLVDLRDPKVREAFDTRLSDLHVFWSDLMASGDPVPTWNLSDRLRKIGADGILTPSRSRPDLTHLTLFRWNIAGGPTVQQLGDPLTF